MAKGCYVGVNGVAHKVKKGYIGVDGKAMRVKKAYIGIGGVARPCWSGGELAYYGTVTAMSDAYGYSTTRSAALSSRVFFGGKNYISHYNTSLSKGSVSHSSESTSVRGASNPSYALFARDVNGTHSVTAFNASATKTTATALGENKGSDYDGAGVGNYALFTGGYVNYSYSKVTYAYNTSLTRSTPAQLGTGRSWTCGASVGDYALFAGGLSLVQVELDETDDYGNPLYDYVEGELQSVEVYNTSLTRSTRLLSILDSDMVSASSKEYACFCASGAKNLEFFNASLTRTSVRTAVGKYNPGMAFLEGYLIVGGGINTSNKFINSVEVYDKSLTKIADMTLATARHRLAAETIGNYALFAGGWTKTSSGSTAATTNVEAFTIV